MSGQKKTSAACCSACGCHSIKWRENHLSFHQFPRKGIGFVTITNKFGVKEKIDRLTAWENVLKLERKPSLYMKICSLHFKSTDFIPSRSSRRILKKNAVPSLKLFVASSTLSSKKKSAIRDRYYCQNSHEAPVLPVDCDPLVNVNNELKICSSVIKLDQNVLLQESEDVLQSQQYSNVKLEIIKEEPEDVEFNLEDLHHSVDIKEENCFLEYQEFGTQFECSDEMPLSAAERMKRRREKLKKEGKYDDYKKNHSKTCRKSRAKKRVIIDKLPQSKKLPLKEVEKAKIRKRVAKHRLLKSLQTNHQFDLAL